jgi:hypothetical protein
MNPTENTKQQSSKNEAVNEAMGKRYWIKLWVDPWLDGTTRYQLTDAQTAFWVDLMAMAGRSRFRGIICAGRDGEQWVGYPIARYQALRPSVDVEATLALFAQTGKIAIEVTHEQPMKLIKIEILNWKKYQSDLDAQAKWSQDYRNRKKQRQGERQAAPGGNVRQRHATEAEAESEADADTEAEEEGTAAAAAPHSPAGEDPESKSQEFFLEAWTAIGEEGPFGPPEFRAAWPAAYRDRLKDKPLYVTMEMFINSFGEKRIPKSFFNAKHRIEDCERQELGRNNQAKPQHLPKMPPLPKREEGACQKNS